MDKILTYSTWAVHAERESLPNMQQMCATESEPSRVVKIGKKFILGLNHRSLYMSILKAVGVRL